MTQQLLQRRPPHRPNSRRIRTRRLEMPAKPAGCERLAVHFLQGHTRDLEIDPKRISERRLPQKREHEMLGSDLPVTEPPRLAARVRIRRPGYLPHRLAPDPSCGP